MTRLRLTFTTILTIMLCINAIAQPRIEQGKTQTWYGRVNRWTISKQTLRQELNLMKKCGVSGYMIEMACWGRYNDQALEPWSEQWIRQIEKSYRHILRECRKRDLWLFVSVVNDNMGKGKYGDKGPKLEVVYDSALQLIKIIKKYGHKGVIIQPVAETQTSAGQRFEQDCLRELKDFSLVYNGNGGHPDHTPDGYHFRATHPSHIVSSVDNDALVISDHGIIIRELSVDGGLESKGDPEKIQMWVNRLQKQGIAVVGYYAFKYADFDPEAIRALGKKIASSESENERSDPKSLDKKI